MTCRRGGAIAVGMLHVGAALAQGHEEELAKKLNNPVAAMKATQ